MDKYQICTRCIMDTTDPEITFDSDGVCNHCHNFDNNVKPNWYPNEEGEAKLKKYILNIKEEEKNKEYDCVIGLSGGVDSSYLLYKMQGYGLRVLAVHVDGGWNSEISVGNIEKLVKEFNIDLHTHVIDWDEMKDLQVAFMKSGLSNQDVPQDHAFFAALYNYAVKNNVRYVFNGSNFATESILPSAWGYNAMDVRLLEDIHRKFGKKPLKTFPKVSFFEYYFYYPYIKKMTIVKPLNYMPYNKDAAIEEMNKEFGWQYYGGKHHESRFTKFFQNYYLPTKFGYDKRKAHLSSLIVAGQMTREQALEKMQEVLYPADQLAEDRVFVLKKLGLKEEEFYKILHEPNKHYTDYSSNAKLYGFFSKIKKLFAL